MILLWDHVEPGWVKSKISAVAWYFPPAAKTTGLPPWKELLKTAQPNTLVLLLVNEGNDLNEPLIGSNSMALFHTFEDGPPPSTITFPDGSVIIQWDDLGTGKLAPIETVPLIL